MNKTAETYMILGFYDTGSRRVWSTRAAIWSNTTDEFTGLLEAMQDGVEVTVYTRDMHYFRGSYKPIAEYRSSREMPNLALKLLKEAADACDEAITIDPEDKQWVEACKYCRETIKNLARKTVRK